MFRSFVFKLFPGLAERVESESRQWLIQCPTCGYEISVWEAGGIRYKAKGNTSRLATCQQCNTRGLHRVIRQSDQLAD